jgi:hypothetical protein
VHYDVLAESVALLDGAPLPDAARLSRRVRHVPLAVDRDGDVAATMFLRRGVSGIPLVDVHALELTGSGWRLLGGGSGPGEDATGSRPGRRDLGGLALSSAGGGTSRSSRGRFGFPRRGWVSWAEVRAAEEVAVLRVDDRLVPVPGHGCAVVVWAGRPPSVTALDASGAVLGAVALLSSR